MREPVERYLRWFVGVSLVLGGVALLAGAIGLQSGIAGAPLILGLVVAALVVMIVTIALEPAPRWPWFAPAVLPVVLLMTGILWARFEAEGHLFLSGFAPFVALIAGYGILKKRPWAWPVSFVAVAGVGPTLLLFVPLNNASIAAAFLLFAADALFLLALAPSYFEPSPVA